jgi:iron complex outermembrane receptor protein
MVLLLVGLTPRPAQAQEAAANSDQLSEIVVTATKRSESLSKVPLAISALSQDDLTSQGVVGLQDLTSAAPSLEIKTLGFANAIQVTIRGITNSDFNPGASPAVATYIDGIYIARPQGLNGDLYDIERVEVLRGPQGTLYGRNATGGNINVVTAEPTHVFGAAADVSFGNFNDAQVHGMLNLPITDELAIRGAFSTHRNDGFYDSEGSIANDYGAADDYAGRLTALWTPGSFFRWRIAVEDAVENGTPAADFVTAPDGRPVDGLPVYKRPFPNSVEPSKYIDNFTTRSRMDFKLSDQWSVAYLAGYENIRFQALFATAGTGTTAEFDGHRTASSKSYNHEVDLNFDSENIKNIVGATYFHESEWDFDAYHFYVADLAYRGGTSFGPTARDGSWGVFDQANISATSRLRFIAGVRYSSESKESQLNQFGQEYCALDTSLSAMLSQMYLPGCAVTTESPVHANWSNTNWKAGVEYDLTDQIMNYLTVTTGFKAGGLNIGGLDLVPASFSPEKVTSYEIGSKGKFLDNRLSVYSDIFYMTYTNLQVTQLSGVADITDNAARALIYGLEVQSEGQLTSNDRLSGFFDYLHATYGTYNNAVDQQTGLVYPSLAGNSLTNSPKYSAKLTYQHQFSLGDHGSISPSASVYYQSVSFLREFNLPIDRVGGYGKANFNVEYTDPSGRWKAAAYVDNAANRAIRDGSFTVVGQYLSDYDAPRTFGARIAYKY